MKRNEEIISSKLAEIKRKQYNQPHTKQLKTIAEVQTKMEERIYKLEKLPYKDPPRVFFDPKTPNFLHNSTFSLPEVEISDFGHKIPSQINNHSNSDQQRRKFTPSGSRSNNGKTISPHPTMRKNVMKLIKKKTVPTTEKAQKIQVSYFPPPVMKTLAKTQKRVLF